MTLLCSLRNYDKLKINFSIWSKKKINLENLFFVDENNNQYEIISTFLSDTKLSAFITVSAKEIKDEVRINVIDKISGVVFSTLKANRNIEKIHVVSCDSPNRKDTKNMWELLNEEISENCIVLHLGDQLYADIKDSLDKDYAQCSGENLTAIEWQEQIENITIDNFYTGCGEKLSYGWHYFAWDDHEVDNAFRSTEEWFYKYENQPHTEGAIKAYSQCQLGKNDPHTTQLYELNNINLLIVDQRSYMTLESIKNGERWLTDDHKKLIVDLLSKCNTNKQTFVCFGGAIHSTTPITDLKVFLEWKIMGGKSEIDHGASSQNAPVYCELLNILDSFNFKNTPILIGGDIHMAVVKDIITSKNTYKHVISSAIRSPSKNHEPLLTRILYFLERNFEIDNRLGPNTIMKTIYSTEWKNYASILIDNQNKIKFIITDEKVKKTI